MYSEMITKTNGRDKVIDFRDYLTAADAEDYAILHNKSISKKQDENAEEKVEGNFPSVIRVTICDSTKGTGDKSVTVSSNLSPAKCAELYEVCKQNVGSRVISNDLSILTEQRSVNRKLMKAADMGYGILIGVLSVCKRIAALAKENKELPGMSGIAAALEQKLSATKEKMIEATEAPKLPPAIIVPQQVDYSYSQDRVHSHNVDSKGYAPVQRFQINRTTYRPDGQVSNYPWYIKVTNCRAKITTQPTGATTFDSKTIIDATSASINVSDADMFRMMHSIDHFITVWELTTLPAIVRAGEELRKKEYEEYKEKQKGA